MKIEVWTDGSSRGNPGPGGWGSIILTPDEVIELGGRENMTTNNRMELQGTIHGLSEVDSRWSIDDRNLGTNSLPAISYKLSTVEVCTDSQYVKKGITEWIGGWINNNWKNSQRKDVLNRDLWEALKKEVDRLEKGGVKVTFKYVKGHAGIALNERADVIATSLADNSSIELYRGGREDYVVS